MEGFLDLFQPVDMVEHRCADKLRDGAMLRVEAPEVIENISIYSDENTVLIWILFVFSHN
jgi:hypothetical protein